MADRHFAKFAEKAGGLGVSQRPAQVAAATWVAINPSMFCGDPMRGTLAQTMLDGSTMALPRRVIPGASYLITRRTCQRTFRLRPSPEANAIAAYCLAAAAEKHGIKVHAFVLMSDHHHLVLTDPRGLLPDFMRDLHRSMSKAFNASQGQRENLWSAEHASAVLLPTADDVIEKIAHAVANPVAAGLVADPSEWPGLLLWKQGIVDAERPPVYFSLKGKSPARAQLQICAPPGLEAKSAWERIRQAVADRVADARQQVRSKGMRFIGAAAVLAQSFLKRATSFEAKRTITPVLAAGDAAVREAYQRVLRAFREAYDDALRAWKQGDRSVVFPAGTWWMRVHHRAQVLPAGE